MMGWLTQTETNGSWLTRPETWALAALAVGLWLAIPHSTQRSRRAGAVLCIAGIVLLVFRMPIVGPWFERGIFAAMATLTIGGCVAAISMRSPVYSAIWFAMSLLGTAGLMMEQYAQFLGVTTTVVYAGAIVVTFLFVVMLAQPEGHDTYDRLSWGRLAKPTMVLAGGLLMGLLGAALTTVREGQLPEPPAATTNLTTPHHIASLGNQLFGTHLVAVELAGTLLLAALVGAIAIMIHGKPQRAAEGELND
ncbi:MAG: NADH-quinone oxidoreductase subunit [Planctomycetota bacterium]|jgi:NADH-quinone oxidoreductase subunit J